MAARKPNVLLLVVDACRFDYLRGPKADTPNVDAFADEATDFRRAISPAPWTLPSVTSILTGRHPHEHGATSRGFAKEGGRTVTADLRDAGYRCVHLSPTTWIGDWLPQGEGFHRVVEFTGPEHRRFEAGADVRELSEGVARGPEWYATVLRRALRSDNPVASLANAAVYRYRELTEDAWLDDVRASERAARLADEQIARLADRDGQSPGDRQSARDGRSADSDQSAGDEPFFAYAHLMDPHLPFYVPEEFRSPTRPPDCTTYDEELDYLDDLMDDLWAIRLGERRLSEAERRYLRRRYADEVEYADAVVGVILDSISRHGVYDDTLVVLTADHGEHLGEGRGRTLLDHQASVGLPLLRVPLVVRYPGAFESARRDNLVQTTDVAGTVRELAGLDHDPVRTLRGEDSEARPDDEPSDSASPALAEYAGVVSSHPPEEVADQRLFQPRRSAVLGDWKLDAVGGEYRARRVDWSENEAEPVALDAVPARVREKLEAVLAEGRAGPPARPSASAASNSSAGDPSETDSAVPEDVEARLRRLGYR